MPVDWRHVEVMERSEMPAALLNIQALVQLHLIPEAYEVTARGEYWEHGNKKRYLLYTGMRRRENDGAGKGFKSFDLHLMYFMLPGGADVLVEYALMPLVDLDDPMAVVIPVAKKARMERVGGMLALGHMLNGLDELAVEKWGI